MADPNADPKTQAPNQPTPEAKDNSGDAPKQPQDKIYTTDMVTATVADAIAKNDRKWEGKLTSAVESAVKDAEKRLNQSEQERLASDNTRLQGDLERANERAELLETQLALFKSGCTNPERATRLLTDEHLNAEGELDLDAIKKDFPEYFPQEAKDTQPETKSVNVLPQRQSDGNASTNVTREESMKRRQESGMYSI